jgi:capsular polysaccharide biosynthesis protein
MQEKLKRLLKRYLPLTLLRQVQLEVNKLRIKTIDKVRFPEQLIPAADFVVQRNEYPFRIYPIATAHLDSRLRQQFERDNLDWTQDEYLLVYEQPCVIEPRYGWALTTQGRLLYPSLGFSRVPYLHKPDNAAKTLRGVVVEDHPELVSLRDTGEENYYHFYNDVLAKLFFLEEKLNLSPDVPLLVAQRLYEKPYFQYFLKHPYLRDRRWIIQDQQYIRSQRTYFCKPLTHTPKYYSRALSMVQPEDLAGAAEADRRLFITRSPQRLRFIENNAEIAAICQEWEFESVDFDELTLPQQIRAMSQARYVVGIHGAGLTNILFRSSRPLGLLEIYPPSTYFPFHYVLMANQLGFQYDGIIAQPGTKQFSGGFYVDPTELRQHLAALLQAETAKQG